MRGLSWTWALNAFAAPDVADDTPWTVDLLLALDRQLAHVERNLSYYFSPNTHLLGEALALYVCGLALPFLRASTRRVEIGRRILIDEIGRQIAKDGSHRERSSHYHRYTLDFYAIALAIAEIAGDRAADPFRDAVERLSTAAAALADDGGRVPHFGDEDGGAAMPICWRAPDDVRGSLAVADVLLDRGTADAQEEALWLLSHPIFEARARRRIDGGVAVRSIALSEMGYFVSRSPGGVHVVMHAGPHGYMRGGHAHADALSITASLRDMPLLIDAGTGVYTADPKLREQFRSTKSHNTVTLDGRNQSHSDGPFHWKQRAVTSAMVWHAGDGFDYFEAAHDGYSPFEHRRHVMSIHDDLLIVMDLIAGGGSQPDSAHTAASHWHIDPRWSVRLAPGRATLSHDDARVDLVTQGGQIQHFAADAELGLGWHGGVDREPRAVPRSQARRVQRGTPGPLEGVRLDDETNPAGSDEERPARRSPASAEDGISGSVQPLDTRTVEHGRSRHPAGPSLARTRDPRRAGRRSPAPQSRKRNHAGWRSHLGPAQPRNLVSHVHRWRRHPVASNAGLRSAGRIPITDDQCAFCGSNLICSSRSIKADGCARGT